MEKFEQEKWDINRLRKAIAPPIDWARSTACRCSLPRVGCAARDIDRESILYWLSDVRRIFEDNGVPRAVWDYCTPNFSIITCGPNAWPTVGD